MMDISIIGAGRLGTSLGYALSKKGYRVKALSCKSLPSAKESRKIIGEGMPLTDNSEAARRGELVILCVPDEVIKKVSKELAASSIKWSEKFVFHCSGLHTSEILKPLKRKGTMTASFHPVQSFSQKRPGRKQFKGIYFGLEGCSEALSLGKKVVRHLGGHFIILQPEDKPLYHTACSIASNFFVVLLDMAISLLEGIGFKNEEASQILLPLVKGTLHNVKKFNIGPSLTGPVIRGDRKSIEKHLDSLRNLPFYQEVYSKLASQALEIAKREKKLSPQKITALRNLLGGK